MIDMCRVYQAVHRRVDARCRTPLAVQTEVERRDHLVLALDARVDPGQCAHPVQPQRRQTLLGQRAQVAARPLHPQQLDILPGHRVRLGALRRGVPTGIVGVLRIGAESVAPLDQLGHCLVRHLGDVTSSGSMSSLGVSVCAVQVVRSGRVCRSIAGTLRQGHKARARWVSRRTWRVWREREPAIADGGPRDTQQVRAGLNQCRQSPG